MNEKNVKIIKREHVFKDYASTYNVEILNYFNSEIQLQDTEYTIKSKLIDSLFELRGFKLVATLVLLFKKIASEDKTKHGNFYSSSKAEIIINESGIDDAFESVYPTNRSNIQKSLGRGSS